MDSKYQRRELAGYGFVRPLGVRIRPWLIIGGTLALALVLGFIVQRARLTSMTGAQASTTILTVGAFVFGYWQWLQARNEASFERFYDRLNIPNQRLDLWPAARVMMSAGWAGDEGYTSFQRTMYVFLELDNLEYAVEKYRLGYMGSNHAFRALATFRARCSSPQFLDKAVRMVEIAGYYDTTVEVVKRVKERAANTAAPADPLAVKV